MAQKPRPIYSHGGGPPTPPASVAGTTTGSGRPVNISGAGQICPPMTCINTGSAQVVFYIDCNNGALDGNFTPPSNEWVPQFGPITLAAGASAIQPLSLGIKYWRTRLTSVSAGGELISYVGAMFDRTGQWVSANYPEQISTQAEN